MKFLLAAVNAKYIHSNPAVYSLRAYAGAALRPHIELAEYTINQRTPDILADLYERKPDVIGFSCYIWNWSVVQELLAELPKLLPRTDIWLGGPEVSYDAPELLRRFPQLAGIMVGEGEATFRELLEWYVSRGEADGAALREIAGLCLPAKCADDALDGASGSGQDGAPAGAPGGAPFYTSPRELLDLNTLPFLYGEPLESGQGYRFFDRDNAFEDRIIYYESSRGCPYCCSYCLSSVDRRLRIRDIDVTKRELQFFLDNRVKQVKFIDRTFNCSHEHAMEIWKYIQDNDNGVTNFHFEISADILREEEIALLNGFRPGLAQLEIGVQSANQKTLAAVQRVTDMEKLEANVAALRKGRNIHLHLDLIAGLPYEDFESFGHSFDRVYAMRPEQLQLGFLKVLKGSAMQEKAREYGICYTDRPPYEVLYTKWLSYEDVLRLKKIEEMVEIYYNSNQFTHTIAFLEQAFATPFAMYGALAEFYTQEGYFAASPARARRYEILLRFAGRYDEKYRDVYRELLTFDLYLRENLKSRPAFAPQVTEQARETARKFYQEEAKQRFYLPAYADYDGKQLGRMTHLEPFCYPVWDEERMAACREGYQPEKTYVLFDYDSSARNPLTYEAAIHILPFRNCVPG